MSATFEEYSHFFEVSLDLFSGPIDLLLHLVKQRELPIEKLSLATVASQYMDCIEAAQRFDLEIAGEYLVIATTLLSIKSSILLGEPVTLVEDEEGNLVDPHEELLRRLREAEVYRDSARELGARAVLGIDVFANPPALNGIKPLGPAYLDHDPMLLGKAFMKILAELKKTGAMEIPLDPVSVVERMMEVIDRLRGSGGALPFEKLIPDLFNRAQIIATFISLLELCKRQIICIHQEENFSPIMVGLADAQDLDLSRLSSEFDFYEAEAARPAASIA